jgi:hypothetical protein
MLVQIHNRTRVKSIPILQFAWLIFSQATHKFRLRKNDYFCHMEMDIRTEEIKEIFLGDKSRFSYTITQVEITNVLGAAVAILDEYCITNSAGENYKLYKTNEGNWYDILEINKGVNNTILIQLKLIIDLQINSETI